MKLKTTASEMQQSASSNMRFRLRFELLMICVNKG